MTEKRFTEIISTQKVIDNQTAKEYNCLIDDELLELLNELHEENQSLKFQLDECQNHKLYSRRELEKENQRLQKENKELEEFRYTVFKRMDELRL